MRTGEWVSSACRFQILFIYLLKKKKTNATHFANDARSCDATLIKLRLIVIEEEHYEAFPFLLIVGFIGLLSKLNETKPALCVFMEPRLEFGYN